MSTEVKQKIEVGRQMESGDVAQSKGPRLLTPLEEAEHLFERLMANNWLRTVRWNWPLWGSLDESWKEFRVPSVEIIDRDKDMLIRLEMPGVDRKDVTVVASDHLLSIEGRIAHEEKTAHGEVFRCEIQKGNFMRKLSVPSGVDVDKISATLREGVLEITLPKFDNLQRRTIQIT